MPIWLNVIDEGDRSGPVLLTGTERYEDAELSAKVKRSREGPYIVEALASYDAGKFELDDVFEAAFRLGRQYEARQRKKSASKKK